MAYVFVINMQDGKYYFHCSYKGNGQVVIMLFRDEKYIV